MWTKISRNAVSNLTGTVVSLVTGFFLMPFTVRHIGMTAFGIWVLVNSVVGYMGLLDLGLAPTLVKKSAEYLEREGIESSHALSRLVSTIFLVYVLLGCVLGLGIVSLAIFPHGIFKIPQEEMATFDLVLGIVGLQAALNFPMSIWNGLASSLQDFHFVNGMNIACNLLRALITVLLLRRGYGLVSLVIMGFSVSVLSWVAGRLWIRRRLPRLQIKLSAFDRSRMPELAQFSGATVIGSLAVYSLGQADRVMLGVFLPVAAITTYEVGARLHAYSRNVFGWLSVILPAASALDARDDRKLLRQLYLQGTKYLLVSYAAVVVALLAFGRQFILLWMGPQFVQATPIMTFLLIGSFYQSQNVIAHVILLGMNRLRVFTWVMSLYPVVVILLGVTFIQKWGALGMAAALAVTMILMETAFMPYILRVFECSLSEFLGTCIRPAVLPAVPCLGWIWAVRTWVPASNWASLIFDVFGCLLVYGISFWTIGASRSERQALQAKIMELWRSVVGVMAWNRFTALVSIRKRFDFQ